MQLPIETRVELKHTCRCTMCCNAHFAADIPVVKQAWRLPESLKLDNFLQSNRMDVPLHANLQVKSSATTLVFRLSLL